MLQQYLCKYCHRFLNTEVYPVRLVVGAANMAKPESVDSYMETTEIAKWSIPQFVFK